MKVEVGEFYKCGLHYVRIVHIDPGSCVRKEFAVGVEVNSDGLYYADIGMTGYFLYKPELGDYIGDVNSNREELCYPLEECEEVEEMTREQICKALQSLKVRVQKLEVKNA